MSATDLQAIAPLLVLAAGSVLVLLLAAFFRHHGVTFWTSQVTLLLSIAALFVALPSAPRPVTPLLVVDDYGLFFSGLILVTTLAVNALARDYLAQCSRAPQAFYILLLVATLGALVLVASRHFAALFLGLETLSVALFGLIAYTQRRWRPLEAGMKYLILAGVSAAFLLLGMALIYGETGTLAFSPMAGAGGGVRETYLLAGVALLLTGIGFKLSLVPFHMWVADIYQGAPAPVSAFLATVSKGAVFALLLRYLPQADFYRDNSLLWALSLVAIASMLVGNWLALLQDNLKRLLAYSSVAHLGYLLVVVIAGGPLAVEAAGYYLAAYFVTLLGAFGVITLLSGAEGEAESLADYQGLFWRHPWLAAVLVLSLLSLAGIPVTMGFVAKFYVLAVGVNQMQWPLVFSLIIASAIGLYYYLRVIVQVFRSPEAAEARAGFSLGGGLVVMAAALVLLLLGVYPAPLMALLHGPAMLP